MNSTKKPFYCQREIEDLSKCEVQCDHCKVYFAPLERLRGIVRVEECEWPEGEDEADHTDTDNNL